MTFWIFIILYSVLMIQSHQQDDIRPTKDRPKNSSIPIRPKSVLGRFGGVTDDVLVHVCSSVLMSLITLQYLSQMSGEGSFYLHISFTISR